MHLINKRSSIKLLPLIILIAFLVGCSDNPNKLPTSNATLQDNVYNNTFFGFNITIPNGWYSVNKETMAAISDRGKDMIAGEDKNLEASIEAAQKNVFNLFQAFEVAPGTPIEFFNSNISCVAERVGYLPGIKTGKDYLLNAKQLMESGQIKIMFSEEINSFNVAGKDFYILSGVVPVATKEIKLEMYATFIDDFILAFAVNYLDSNQQKATQESINSINFY